MAKFKEMLQASLKSKDTEEWLDVWFTRPIGLAFALVWQRLGVHPNTISILSIFLGIGAAWMFWHTDTLYNIYGVVLLMLANFCDSTDGQLARLTNKKTLLGRGLDGFASEVWFVAIYIALCLRMMPQFMPATDMRWGLWIWVLAFISGIMSHSPQALIADYYRQIHLFFLKGKEGSELDNSQEQWALYKATEKGDIVGKLFYYNYAKYCAKQEKRTRHFQMLKKAVEAQCGSLSALPQELRETFLKDSRPLMKYTNILSFNTRAIVLYITCIADCPWVYMLFEITVMNVLSIYMHRQHDLLCDKIREKLQQQQP